MKTITITSGYIMAETEEVEELLYKLIEDDTLWEYISVLISKDVKNKQMTSDRRLLSIEKMLQDINSKLSAKPVIQTIQPTPAPLEAPAKPAQTKKVKKTKVSGKGSKGFLAAAQKASSFR